MSLLLSGEIQALWKCCANLYSLEVLCLRSQSPALQGMLSKETDGLISQEADIVQSLAAVIMVCTVV
jgi:hypothetical protein